MKKSKILVPALAMLVMSTAATVTGTVAWFSANNVVNASGMKVKASTSDSLVIADDTPVGTATSVAYTSAVTTIKDSTHDSTWGTYTNGLKTLASRTSTDAATGVEGGSDSFVAAANDSASSTYYYVDYVAYIASAGTAMTGKTLSFSYDATTVTAAKAAVSANTDGSRDTIMAITTDIYVQSVATKGTASTYSNDTYYGKLTYVGAAESTTPFVSKSSVNIPLNTDTSSFMRVTFRIYLDGALEKSSGQKYVYTNKIDTSEVALGIDIKVA